MGSNNSSLNKYQCLVAGLQRSGKTLFIKKLCEMGKNNEAIECDIDQTIGFNLINYKYLDVYSFDIWEMGGDSVSRTYWPTFYRNLKIDIIVFMINLYDLKSHQESLKELLVLINEEELKGAKFVVIFNCISKDTLIKNSSDSENEQKEIADSLVNFLRECPIHDYDNRVISSIFDVSKMKGGENNTIDLLKEIFSVQGKNANN